MREYIISELEENVKNLKTAKSWLYEDINVGEDIKCVIERCESMINLLKRIEEL